VPPRSLVSYEEKKVAIVPKRPAKTDASRDDSVPA
jgi:hypothetical protein